MKVKTFFLLLIVFVAINITVYKIVDVNEKQRIGLVVSENIKTLQTHYEILLHTQKIASQNLYERTVNTEKFIEIISRANTADKDERAVLRKELQTLLNYNYELAKNQGVLQYHIVLLDNISFLRMHKTDRFGDDLTNIREDFRYTSITKKPIRGFTQGRTAHAFRNTFPIFDKNGEYIGAIEISFSSDGFQKYLTDISHIHTHFLVKKDIFEAKTWERDDLILKYKTSAEHPNYMMAMNSEHTIEECIVENKRKLAAVSEEIIKNEKLGKAFAAYVTHQDSHVDVVSFIPIQDINNNLVGWLVSYEENAFINMTLKSGMIIKIISFLASLVLIYFIYKVLKSKEKIEQEHNLLNDVLSTTDDIIFVTDFKTIGFSNKSFKETINLNHLHVYDKDVLDMFVVEDGFLHKELLINGESFIRLIERTPESKRVVSILDKHFTLKSFKIDIIQTNYQDGDNYLVTLTDITKMKEQQLKTEKKAYTDGLTGVFNRSKFDEIIVDEIKNSKRNKIPLSLAILDIDKFKDFNDTYGHLIGDEVLISLAQHVKNYVRETDVFARWGGEEFVLLFRGTDIVKAEKVSEKIRESISRLEHVTAGHFTASFGVTELREDDTLETMFKRCDKALYRAKEHGRNRVEVL